VEQMLPIDLDTVANQSQVCLDFVEAILSFFKAVFGQ